jgi:hypothetical protein
VTLRALAVLGIAIMACRTTRRGVIPCYNCNCSTSPSWNDGNGHEFYMDGQARRCHHCSYPNSQ